MDLDLIQQINSQLKEMNELLGRQASSMSSQLKASKNATDAANNQKNSNNALNTAQGEAGTKTAAQTKLSEMAKQANEKTAAATNQLAKSLADGKTALFGLASALLDTTPGLTKYSNSVESATDAISGVVSIFGPLGSVAGLLLKGLSALVGASFKYSDALVNAYDTVASAGAGIGTSAEGIAKLGQAARLSSGTLPYLTKNVEALGSDLRALGTTSSGGVEAFSKVIAVGENQLKGYRKLGFTQEELIESQANYLKLQAMAGADLKKSPEQLQKASLKYIDELNAFAEVTGISKKRQEDALAQAMAQENFNAYMNKLESDKKSALERGDKAEAERIDSVIQAKQNLAKYAQANFSAAKAQAVLEGISTDGNTIMTENTARLKMSGINIQKINENANKGMDQTGELAGQSAKSAEDFRKNFGELGTAVGKESRNLQDTFFQDNGTRMAAARDADLKGNDRQKIFNQRMQTARANAEAIKKRNSSIMDQKAEVEAQERAARIAFDGLLSQLSKQLNGLLMKVLPYITKAIQFMSDNFDLIITAAKTLGIAFAGLGAIAATGAVIGSLKSFGEKIGGLFGKKSGAPGSKTNPMYVSFDNGSGGLSSLTGGNKGPSGGGSDGGSVSALKLAAKSAPQVLLGAATLGAAMVELGAGLAAATWLMGGALTKFAKGLKEFEKLDGENLKNAGIGLAGLGTGIAAMGVGGITGAINNIIGFFTGEDDPLQKSVEMLTELQKANIDRKRVENNGAALVAFAKAMAAVAGLGAAKGLGDAIKGMYEGVASIMGGTTILDDFVSFSKLDINAKKTKNNSIAFKYFSDAMASFKGIGSPMGTIGTTLALATNKFFGTKPPLEQFVYFSHLNVNQKKTKTNATSFRLFSEAMATYKGGQGLLSAVSTIAAAGLNKLFGQDSAIDSFYKFSQMDFGKNAEVNAKAFLNFSKGMNILSGGDKSTLEELANVAGAAGGAIVGAIGGAATAVGQVLGIIPGPDAKAMNFIGKIESGGDYNKLVGGKTKTNPPLTAMSVAEVLEFQNRMLASGHESTALGKYQIIRPTLAGMVKSGKISPNAKFDQATQDNAALALMKARGRDKYRQGDMPADTYANNLAKEWASLPMPNGKSFYAGTGSNKSLVSRTDFVNSLKARTGGLFKGPTGGYPVELHGTELIIPVTPDSILTKLMQDTPEAEKMSNEIFDAVAGALDGNKGMNELDDLIDLDTQMKEMLVNKFNKILDVLDNKNTTSRKMLKTKLAG